MTKLQTVAPRAQRADAKKNYEHLLAVGRVVVAEQGGSASLRDVARKAGVGLGTLYRHFPTREALLEALLRTGFDELTVKAQTLAAAREPDEALVTWLRDFVANATTFRGVIASMIAAIADEESALHASCVAMRSGGARLLVRAQEKGTARADVDGTDLFALAGALAWTGDQAVFESRARHLFEIVASALFTRTGERAPRRRSPARARK